MLRQSVTHRWGWSGALGELPGLKVTGMHPCATCLPLQEALTQQNVLQPNEALSVGQGQA